MLIKTNAALLLLNPSYFVLLTLLYFARRAASV